MTIKLWYLQIKITAFVGILISCSTNKSHFHSKLQVPYGSWTPADSWSYLIFKEGTLNFNAKDFLMNKDGFMSTLVSLVFFDLKTRIQESSTYLKQESFQITHPRGVEALTLMGLSLSISTLKWVKRKSCLFTGKTATFQDVFSICKS